MFTLPPAIQNPFANNRKLYIAVVDFEKAFDLISRKLLWPILLKTIKFEVSCTIVLRVCTMMLKPKLDVGLNLVTELHTGSQTR